MVTTLANAREINKAVWDNVNGRNNGVYCQLPDGSVHRINRARTVYGQLQVHSLVNGCWIVPLVVYYV
jgi:hypothetical protein